MILETYRILSLTIAVRDPIKTLQLGYLRIFKHKMFVIVIIGCCFPAITLAFFCQFRLKTYTVPLKYR